MILTNKQQQGLKIAVERYNSGERYTCISGPAGVGKSTLVRAIIEALDVPEEETCFACFTGKAAQVLQKMGNKNVMTLHKLLFDSRPLPNGRFVHTPKPIIDYTLVIVDEVSMAPKSLMQLLFAHEEAHVICLGDPFQLPPLSKDEDNGLLDHPHVFLDEIMRQAQDSEIIRVSMDIRAGKDLSLYNGKDVKILNHKDLNTGMLQWADQILCGTNKTRIAINNQMRTLLGREGSPQDGDKIICLRNYWDDASTTGDVLINGTIGYLKNSYPGWVKLPYWIEGGKRIDILSGDLVCENNSIYEGLKMDQKMIMTGNRCVTPNTEYKLGKSEKYRGLLPKEFTYGYAITTWKAQGSQWNNILVIEEGHPFDPLEHKKFLYTSITRAIDKCVIIKK